MDFVLQFEPLASAVNEVHKNLVVASFKLLTIVDGK